MTAFDVPDDLDDDPRLWTGESMMPRLELAPMELCDVCQEPTETPPQCRDCHEAEKRADEDAAKAYREGRYE